MGSSTVPSGAGKYPYWGNAMFQGAVGFEIQTYFRLLNSDWRSFSAGEMHQTES